MPVSKKEMQEDPYPAIITDQQTAIRYILGKIRPFNYVLIAVWHIVKGGLAVLQFKKIDKPKNQSPKDA